MRLRFWRCSNGFIDTQLRQRAPLNSNEVQERSESWKTVYNGAPKVSKPSILKLSNWTLIEHRRTMGVEKRRIGCLSWYRPRSYFFFSIVEFHLLNTFFILLNEWIYWMNSFYWMNLIIYWGTIYWITSVNGSWSSRVHVFVSCLSLPCMFRPSFSWQTSQSWISNQLRSRQSQRTLEVTQPKLCFERDAYECVIE